MFSEPLLAHPAECLGVHAAEHSHSGIITTAIKTMTAPTMKSIWFSMGRQYPPSHRLYQINLLSAVLDRTARYLQARARRPPRCAPKGRMCLWLRVHLGTAPFGAGPYTF
jgi:hypothetical protein